jgi:hypothetical protein
MSCRKYFKSLDTYGHHVQVNFNQNGETVNTIIGGFISFVVRWGLRFFLFLKILDVYNTAKTDFLTITIPYDFTQKSNQMVNFKDMKILLYMRKLSTEAGKNMFAPLPWDIQNLNSQI